MDWRKAARPTHHPPEQTSGRYAPVGACKGCGEGEEGGRPRLRALSTYDAGLPPVEPVQPDLPAHQDVQVVVVVAAADKALLALLGKRARSRGSDAAPREAGTPCPRTQGRCRSHGARAPSPCIDRRRRTHTDALPPKCVQACGKRSKRWPTLCSAMISATMEWLAGCLCAPQHGIVIAFGHNRHFRHLHRCLLKEALHELQHAHGCGVE